MKFLSGLTFATSLAIGVNAVQNFYTDSLQSDVQNWSWGGADSTPNFAAIDLVYAGTNSIYYVSNAGSYGALSLYTSTTFGTSFNALYFAIAGADLGSKIDIHIAATADGADTSFPLSSCINDAVTTATSWTVATCDISSLPAGHTYNRISFQDKNGVGLAWHLDSIYLGLLPPKYPTYSAISVLGSQTIVLFGTGVTANITEINFYKSGSSKKQIFKYKNVKSFSDANFPRTYVDIETPFVPGNLTVVTTSANFSISIGDTLLSGKFNSSSSANYPINPDIYGMAFVPDASYASKYGVTINRWGGNDRTNYNPAIDASNSGNDWYFTNKAVSNAQKFITDTLAWGKAFYSLAALDWVSKDTISGTFPQSTYPDQQKFWQGLGNGVYSNGTSISAPDPSLVYTPWNTTLAEAFLRTLSPRPSVFAIDNEMDIAGSTHRDCHPYSTTYDEILNTRFLPYAKLIKKVFPNATVVGPSSCCWYYYWNSAAGGTDKAAQNGTDFIPWFLDSLKASEKVTGRLLDSLDIHTYPGDGVGFSLGTDDVSAATRLRLTRAFWDPTYVDESWFGKDGKYVSNQPLPDTAMYIPRFRKLIADHYPGTKFGIGEWSYGTSGEAHFSGGLANADTLGIFGRERLDWATYWTSPSDGSYGAAGFWLFRGNASYPFPSYANQISFDSNPDSNYVGIYAGTTKSNGFGYPAVVVVNKHLTNSVLLKINDKNNAFDAGVFVARHFGGNGGAGLGSVEIKIVGGVVVVPAKSALLIRKLY
ncbi:hypothetical protein HK096_002389 [Nowakowskiella sp. JEL0078]|nr:hypothetical protein HK096_002389 [Nowakowskiella sp. JEL0078]